uniref:Uncharacterized protein n=1 Tax=Ditylenchus dipsaci TaxID=166011 RepID=A0A915E4V7_9BILA
MFYLNKSNQKASFYSKYPKKKMSGDKGADLTFRDDKGGFLVEERWRAKFGDKGHLSFEKQGQGLAGGGKVDGKGVSGGGKQGPDGKVHVHLNPQGQKK